MSGLTRRICSPVTCSTAFSAALFGIVAVVLQRYFFRWSEGGAVLILAVSTGAYFGLVLGGLWERNILPRRRILNTVRIGLICGRRVAYALTLAIISALLVYVVAAHIPTQESAIDLHSGRIRHCTRLGLVRINETYESTPFSDEFRELTDKPNKLPEWCVFRSKSWVLPVVWREYSSSSVPGALDSLVKDMDVIKPDNRTAIVHDVGSMLAYGEFDRIELFSRMLERHRRGITE